MRLRAAPATLATRFHHEGHRPQFGNLPDDFFRNQSRQRRPLASRKSNPLVFDVDALAFEELVQEIIDCIEEHSGLIGR
jgi:hypothetical protein